MEAIEQKANEPGDFFDLLAADMDRRYVFYPLPTFPTDNQPNPQLEPHNNPEYD